MEERTYIDKIDVFKLVDNLEKCEVTDDAKKLLNEFVGNNIGKSYLTEDGTEYRNSRSPQTIKEETLRVIDDYLRKWDVMDKASEATMSAGHKYIDNKGGICDEGTIISVFGDMRNDTERVKAFIEAWRKEPAIKVEKDTPRLRLKAGAEGYAKAMFTHLKTTGDIGEEAPETTWNYLCGLTDEMPKEHIVWHGGLFRLVVLIERFFVTGKRLYFEAPKGAIAFICSVFKDENGNEIKPTSLKTTKSREIAKNRIRDDEVWKSMKLSTML